MAYNTNMYYNTTSLNSTTEFNISLDPSNCFQYSFLVENKESIMPENIIATFILVQIIFYVFIYTIGTIGNLLVIYVILVNRKLKTVTNMYLLNLAIADIIYLQGLPFSMVTLAKRKWIFKLSLCKIFWTMTGVNQFTGIFILTVLAFDR